MCVGLNELRTLWRTTLRSRPPPALTKDLMSRFLCWRIQEQALGGLDRETAKLLDRLARGDNAGRPRRLKPGTVLVREYQGERHTITVIAGGICGVARRYVRQPLDDRAGPERPHAVDLGLNRLVIRQSAKHNWSRCLAARFAFALCRRIPGHDAIDPLLAGLLGHQRQARLRAHQAKRPRTDCGCQPVARLSSCRSIVPPYAARIAGFGSNPTIGEPEHVAVGTEHDDFCIDENAGVAYLTTHRENTIDCASLNSARNSNRFIVAGYPLNEELIAPSSAAWGRLPGGYAKIAFVTTDGGTASPLPDGVRRSAKLLRVEFPEPPVAIVSGRIRPKS